MSSFLVTSIAAIVASFKGTLVRAAFGVPHRALPVLFMYDLQAVLFDLPIAKSVARFRK
jgi:hypothetical protein